MHVIPESRSLVLRSDSNADVLKIIPHSRMIEHDGDELVAMHYGLDEAKVLRNMGFNAPHPIMHYYDWPARFTPMIHQKETAAFLTLHKRALCLSAPGCVDADTEYLSPTGWVRIADYDGGRVAQFDPEEEQVTFVSGEYVKLPCTDMIKIKTKYGVDQVLSPEHRCLIYDKRNQTKREVLSAAELAYRETNNIQKSTRTISFRGAAIKTTFQYSGKGIPLSDAEIRVQVAVIADGYFPTKSTTRCFIRIKKDRKKERIRALLNAANIPFAEKSRDYPTAQGFTIFTFYAPWKAKQFDSIWYSCTGAQLSIVADEAKYWDARISPNPNRGWTFSSYVKESADFIQFACASAGHTARVYTTTRERRGATETEYSVFVRVGRAMVGLAGGSSKDITTSTQSTDGYKYCFMVPSTFLLLRRAGCIFVTGNTGKSIASIWAADFLLTEGIVKKVLIIAPLSTLKVVWGREFAHHLPHRSFVICTGSRQKRIELLAKPGVQYVIINHDGFTNLADELTGFDVVVYDECTACKSPSSQRYKKFYRWVNKHNPWLWMLTGTPISQTPADAWTLARLVESSAVPKSFTSFRDIVMKKVTAFKWVPRDDALETCRRVLQPSIRFTLDECMDIPQTNYVGRKTELTKAQEKAFGEMQTTAVAYFGSGAVTAANTAVMLSKLIQIVTGALYGNDGETFAIDSSLRYNTLTELLEEIGDKVIIFIPLKGVQHLLMEKLEKDGYDVALVNGDVGTKERDQIFNDFQNTEKIRVLLAHPRVAAHGLTLTRAKDIIWYAPIYSLEQYEQANARIRRLTTAGKTSVWHIYATAFEAELYRRLKAKQNTLAEFLALVQGINTTEDD